MENEIKPNDNVTGTYKAGPGYSNRKYNFTGTIVGITAPVDGQRKKRYTIRLSWCGTGYSDKQTSIKWLQPGSALVGTYIGLDLETE